MGTTATAQRVVLGEGRSQRRALFADTHHPCLGSGRALPYSADRGKKSVSRQALDELKQQIPLLDYLQAHDWQPARPLSRGRWMGLCPLHARSQTKLPGGSRQEPVLLLRLWPRRRRDSLRRTLSPGEVPASFGVAAPMARLGAVAAGSRRFLSHAVTPPQRGGCLSAPTRSPLAGTDRAHADRLRARRLPARLADAVGLLRCRLCVKPAW